MHIKGIPFDAPLYEVDNERGVEYWNCEGITVLFTVKGLVTALLPEGLAPAADPPVGGVIFNRYGTSVVGPYLEEISILQVRTEGGKTGFYVPYIYVTTDVALAAGREHLGFPKKLADISLTRWSDMVQGTLERPPGKRLITVTMKPFDRLDPATREALVEDEVSIFTLRHVPGLDGHGELTQLFESSFETRSRKDARGNDIVFTGPVSVTYDSPSVIDPVHNLQIGEIIAGVYREYDAVLRVRDILRESYIPYKAVAEQH